MKKKLFLVALGLLSQQSYAAYDRSQDPYYKPALAQADAIIRNYVIQCNGKTYAKITDKAFIEFNKPIQEIRMIGAYGVSESDKLNDKEWAGKFDVPMGKAARIIATDPAGNLTIRDWTDSGEPEFDMLLEGGKWKVKNQVQVYINAWYPLKAPFACSELPNFQS